MDLSFTDAELAFAAEIRAWLAAHLDLPPAFDSLDDEIAWGRRWQAKLAAERWVGIHWPTEYGGRSATPVEVALYNMEYARSRALQPVNRVGINLAGPTLLAHGTDEQKARWLPRILDASEIWCQLFSEPGAGSDLASLATRADAGRRRLAAQRPEGVDVVRAVRAVGDRAGPHRPRRAEAPRHQLRRRRHAGAGHRDPPARPDHGRGRVQRGVLRRRVRPRGPSRRRAARRLGGRQHDARPRAGHRVPVQGAGRPRGVPRRAVRARRPSGAGSTTSRSPTPWPSRSSSSGCCAWTTGGPCPGWPPGSRPVPSPASRSCAGPT